MPQIGVATAWKDVVVLVVQGSKIHLHVMVRGAGIGNCGCRKNS